MALKLKVTLVRSGTNRPQKHKDTIKGLGLTRLHKSVVLNDTPAIRGMIRAVAHMVRVEAAE
ncbi:MAG TPA: 50S ribosomal protein L30 [Haliangiales bacterium]|nr:50S ribosomal protein L30 [Haliangiales bacterium]